ncbi:MAG: hypothetical protein Q4G26_09880 [Paracoccus sp. (in: a-proteobacteria)]|nr:hypothetical protein [Paracoccus sp. (in: a-proteobacteria)]
MIALPDPIGEMQDILALLSVHVMTLSNYTAQHQYPLMIGKGVRNYADAGAVSAAERWFRKPPLSAEFEVTYASLLADISALNHQMARLVWHWVAKLAEQGFGSFRDQVACCMRLTKRYSLQNHPRNHTEACAYALWLLARTKPADAADAFLVQVASILFGAVPFDVPGDSGLDDLAEQVKDILDLTSRAFGAGKEIHSSFKPALNAMMTVYATEIVNAASSHRLTPASGLVATMFRRDTVRSDAQGIKRAFTEMLAAEGYHGMPFPRRADTALDGVSAKIEIDRSGSPGQIAFARYSAQIDLSVDSNYRRFARISESFDLGANGFGLVAAGMSLHMTIQEWNRVRHEASAFGRVANDPGVVVTAAFAEAYAAAYHIARAGIGMTATGMSRTLATDLFDRAPRLAGTAGFRGAAFIEGAVANKTISATARIAGGVGIVMSAALAAEGFKRGDDMMFAGNAIMAVAGTFLFMTSGPVAILAGAAIIVGAVMASFSFDDVESWVNEGFWGRSRQYWGKTRPSIQAQIADAKQLAFPGPSSSELKAFYEAELQRYIEMNSALNITPLRNGRIRVDCAAIQTAADMSRLSVDVKYDAPGWQLGYQRIPGIRKDFESAGVAIVTVPAGNYAASDGKFIVEGRMRSIGAGSIDNDITLTERELW